MSKILVAECLAGVVTVEGLPVQATVISQGTKQSSGVAFIQGDKVYYLTSNATDLKDVIEKTVELVNKIAIIFTSIGSGMTGPATAPPGTLVADVLELQTKATVLSLLKENLK